MMKKRTFSILFLMLLAAYSFAQDLQGIVVDAITGNVLEGVSVLIDENGIATDANGAFLFDKLTASIVVVKASHLGYEPYQTVVHLHKKKTPALQIKLFPKVYLQEQIVVTGNKSGESRAHVPLTVSTITSEELEQSVESNVLPAISGRIPGVFVTRRGVAGFGVADGSAGQITIRGTGGSSAGQVMVLVDGQPQFQGIFGHHFADNYVTSDLEKVEVIKGPASLIYGTNAMGGVINLITKETKKEGFSFNTKLMYGSYDTRKYSASTGYRKNKLATFVSFNRDETDGHRDNSDFDVNTVYAKLVYDIAPGLTAKIDGSITQFEAADPGLDSTYVDVIPDPNDTLDHWVDIKRHNISVTLKNRWGRFSGEVKAYHNFGDHDVYDGWKSYDENYGFSIHQAIDFSKNTKLVAGIDLKTYGGKGGQNVPLTDLSWFSVNETGIYSSLSHHIVPQLVVNAGLRYEDNSMFGSEFIPQLGINWNPDDHSTIKALVSKGFRSPNVRELYFFGSANPELKPESMWNYEIGFNRSGNEKRLNYGITVFYIEGNNLIQKLPHVPSPPFFKNINTGSFEHYGLELEAQYRVGKNFVAQGGYSYLHTDKAILAAPKHTLHVQGTIRSGKFAFSLSNQLVSGLYTNTENRTKESYFLVDGKISYQLLTFAKVFLAGENLLNQSYEINYAYPMPGSTVFGGINIGL